MERHPRQTRHGARAGASRAMKLRTVCGVVTSRTGSLCRVHARQSNGDRHSTRAWQRLRAWVIARHRGQYGTWCPGYGRDPHPAIDLTADHVVPLAAGGASVGPGNGAVLCRSCNSTKGASDADRGYPRASPALVEDRARQMCARGRISREIPVVADPGSNQVRRWAPRLAHVPR